MTQNPSNPPSHSHSPSPVYGELKPCPFGCKHVSSNGEPAVVLICQHDVKADYTIGYGVRCNECGIEIWEEYQPEVIARWNRRAYIELVENRGGVRAALEDAARLYSDASDRLFALNKATATDDELDAVEEDRNRARDRLCRAARALQSNSSGGVGEGDMRLTLADPTTAPSVGDVKTALLARVRHGDARLHNPKGHDPLSLAALNALAEVEADKDVAYDERNQLVALLASMFPSGIARTDIPGWLPEWHGCVYIDLPNGQASWHYHDSQAHLFAHLPPYTKAWDGHTTAEKYDRIRMLARALTNGAEVRSPKVRAPNSSG